MSSFGRLSQVFLLFALTHSARSATIFQDGFESGALGSAWSVSTTEDGRATVTTNFGPATGAFHLLMDDSVNDATFSQVHAALQLDLSNKKNVVLSFKAKSLGNEPHGPFGVGSLKEVDGISLSVDGSNWYDFFSLGYFGDGWQSYSVQLDYYASGRGGFGSDFQLRFSEYDNASAPLDGIAIDDVTITADEDLRAVLEIPTQVVEGSGPHTAYLFLSFEPTNTLELILSVTPAGQLTTPASVVIPAGQRQASFSFSIPNDNLVNLTRQVSIRPTAIGVSIPYGYITIVDDDAPVVTVSVPAELREGVSSNNNARITLDRAPDVPMSFYFSTTPWDELEFSNSVQISPGETQAVFTVNAADDFRIDGNMLVMIVTRMTRSEGVVSTTNWLTTVDNEARVLELVLPPTILEGGTATGSVKLSGTLTSNLYVSLTSLNPGAVTVPPAVTVVAWETTATFELSAADNALLDGSRSVALNASASSFAGTNGIITIRDNEVSGYWIGGLSNIVNVTDPVPITIRAADVEGNPVGGATGPVNLSVIFPDGTSLPLSPATVSLSNTQGWTGNVTFSPVHSASLRLHAEDSAGKFGDSSPFDIMRVLNLPAAADLIWDPIRNRFYASVSSSAGGTNANRIVVIDPASTEISGGLLLNQNPGQLALTSGGENLYVALNGNGTIVRIDPSSMAMASTFAVGADSTNGTYYAGDMSTVAGQPNLLVISRSGPNHSYQHYGVAVYDNEIARPISTQFFNGSRVIEPSADPNIFFGYDNYGGYGFRRLQLNASGITEIEVNTTLLYDYGADMVSDGNKVFSTSGVELDGALMKRLGKFPVGGPLAPNLAANRVYFIEPIDYGWGSFDKIAAYDSVTFSNIRKATMSSPVLSPKGLIRWGTNGLAFLTSSNVVLINSSQLVPNDPPANLLVTIEAAPNPTTVSVLLTYTVTVSNQGPNVARNTILNTELSAHQTIQSIVATAGTVAVSSNSLSLLAGDLVPGTFVELAITALPQSAGSLVCTATAISDPPDPDFADNSATQLVSVGYQLALDTVSELRLAANNLIYDPTRNLLWASVPQPDPHLGRSVVSINPLTGVISEPLAIGENNPMEQCMALSANGRYLYVGLADAPEVHRIDLESNNASVRISLTQGGGTGVASDLEPLDGDGTSFLAATYYTGVAAFDGTVPRPNRTDPYSIGRIERADGPGNFVGAGYNTLSRLSVTASGVAITQSVNGLIPGYQEIRGGGNLLLASSGHLINSSNLTLRANFEMSGSPCLDLSNHRAYLVNGDALYGFDTETLLPTGSFALPVNSSGSWPQTCVRWGLDGFALLDYGKVYVMRWSSAMPASTDSDANGFSDAWEAAYFNSLNVDPAGDDDGDGIRNFLEYLFVTSPIQTSENPVQVSAAMLGNQRAVRIVFPRRAGLSPQLYDFVFSTDLTHWSAAQNVTETVLAVQNVGGVQVETVEALIPATNAAGFFRFEWTPH